ncbi:DNA polymerase III subunit delta [Mesomycoplasma molare]|uniref:DNA polymerase III subunit delta n=1 Tax=Mesomycoplasma molare TaxID=171288 RepID=A0ABY5TV13_9BACT|nr:hypothetical protein [Mesomycoplasma molare]UWD34505.1 hypothetical protein NX772_01590 [Mesomycoplasma molare]
MYFFYGNEEFLINKEIKKIINKNKNYKVIYLNDSSEEEIIEKINEKNLFSEKEIIVIKNKDFFLKNSPNFNNHINDFINENNNKDKIVIFYLNVEKTEKKVFSSHLFKLLISLPNRKQFNKISDKEKSEYIKKIVQFKNGKISEIDAIKLSLILPNDLYTISYEIDKLLNYDSEINSENIDNLAYHFNLESDFAIIDSLLKMDYFEMKSTFLKKISQGIGVNNLISQIFSFLNIIFASNLYKDKKMDDKTLSEIINVHPFRLKKAKEFLKKNNIEIINKMISKLSEIDFNIKNGTLKEEEGFEKFLFLIFELNNKF